MPTSTGSIRTTKKAPCPICQGANCLIMPSKNAVVCLRVSEGCAKRSDGTEIVAKNGLGFVHRLDGKKLTKQFAKLAKANQNRHLSPAEIKAILKRHKSDMSSHRLANAAKSLGVSEKSLRIYGIGYDVDTGCWSFPMYHWERGKGKVLCGLRLRSPDGKRKLCVYGSQNGLFIPEDYDPREIPADMANDPHPYMILTPEGPTDCCAAYDCHYVAIGRPSNRGGIDDVVNLLRDTPPQETVVVADRDDTHYLRDGTPYWPGIEGALLLLRGLVDVHGKRRFCFPPEHAKDLRAWIKEGGTAGVLKEFIVESYLVTPSWLRAAESKLAKNKVKERKQPEGLKVAA